MVQRHDPQISFVTQPRTFVRLRWIPPLHGVGARELQPAIVLGQAGWGRGLEPHPSGIERELGGRHRRLQAVQVIREEPVSVAPLTDVARGRRQRRPIGASGSALAARGDYAEHAERDPTSKVHVQSVEQNPVRCLEALSDPAARRCERIMTAG